MPKLFFLSIILFTSIFAAAQTRLNIFAGPQVTTARYYAKDVRQSIDMKPGLQIGAGAKIEFENRLYFSPAVYYSFKGYKVVLNRSTAPPDPTAVDNNVSVHTLEAAFLLQYDFSKKPSHIFFKLGPSVDFQLAGKEKFNQVDGGRINRRMKYGYADYGRYAVSAVLQVGYEMANHLILYAHYGFGLTNLSNADTGPSIQYRVIGITIGKYFN